MIFFALSVAAFAAVFALGAVALLGKSSESGVYYGLGGLGGVVGGVLWLLAGVTIVPAGSVGVPILFGSVRNAPLESGVNWVSPLARVELMSVRTENYIMSSKHDEGVKGGDDSIVALTSTRLPVPMDVSVPYRLREAAAPWVFEKFGPDELYREKILRNAARAAVRRAVARMTDDEVFALKRDELAESIRMLLEEGLEKLLATYPNPPKTAFVISQILIGDMRLPDSLKASIEAKLAADQAAQAMTFKIKQAELEAQRKQKEAQGIKQFQETVTAGLKEQTIKWKWIEAMEKLADSPNTKIILIQAGKEGLPAAIDGKDDVILGVPRGAAIPGPLGEPAEAVLR